MMAMAHGCPANAAPIAATLHVTGTSQASLKWWFDAVDTGVVSIKADGTMDFEKAQTPVVVTLTLDDQSDRQAGFDYANGFNVFGFNDADSDGYNGLQLVPQHGHYQFRQIDASRTQVGFCYMNRLKPGPHNDPDHYRWSRYVIYLVDPSTGVLQVDPRIGNGSFSGAN